VASVGSGIYLYIQGQSLWEKTRTHRSAATSSGHDSSIEQTAYKANEVIPAPAAGPRNGRTTRTLGLDRNEVSDQVPDRAMAPVRNLPVENGNPGSTISPTAAGSTMDRNQENPPQARPAKETR
jgi:hypothetical protein